MLTIVTLTIHHEKEVPDLVDKIVSRAYSISHVSDGAAQVVYPPPEAPTKHNNDFGVVLFPKVITHV